MWALSSGIAVLFWLFSVTASYEVDAAVTGGRTQVGTITRIDDPDGEPANFVTVDGRERALEDSPPLWTWTDIHRWIMSDDTYTIGQSVEVTMDPDVDWAYDVSKYQGFSWWPAIAGLAFMLGLIAAARRWASREWMLGDDLRWQRWRTTPTSTVTVVEVRQDRRPRAIRFIAAVIAWFDDHRHQLHYLVIESEGQVHYWEAKSREPVVIEPGMTFEVFGRLRHRGHVIGLTEPPLYSTARLD